MTTRARDTWRDAHGNVFVCEMTCPDGVDPVAVTQEIQQLSGASNPERRLTIGLSGEGDGAYYPGAYISHCARLTYATSIGKQITLWIPAPDSSIYLPDGETVDPTAIISLSTAVISTLTDAAGNIVVGYVSGSAKVVALLPVPLQ